MPVPVLIGVFFCAGNLKLNRVRLPSILNRVHVRSWECQIGSIGILAANLGRQYVKLQSLRPSLLNVGKGRYQAVRIKNPKPIRIPPSP